MRFRQFVKPVISLCLVLTLQSVYANGFYIHDKGAIATGLSNAGVTARAGDGSTLYFNPAGMTRLPAMLQIGIDTTFPRVDSDNAGSTAATPGTGNADVAFAGGSSSNPIDPTPIPHVYAVYPVSNSNLWLGLAITAPFGLAVEYDDDWFGRYDSIESKLTTIDIAPTLAWRISDQWSVGGAINVQYADGKLTTALPDPLNLGGPTPQTDGRSKLEGDDWGLGFTVGVLWQPMPSVRVGASYRSQIDHTLDGDLEITGLTGPLDGFNGKQGGSTDIDLPAIASLAIAYEWSDKLTSYLEGNWYGWSSFEEIRATVDSGDTAFVRPQDYSDTWGVAAGLEYKLNETWELRSGIRYDDTPTQDEFRNTAIPDEQSVIAAIGFSAAVTERFYVDGAYQHFFYADASVSVTEEFYSGTPLQSAVTTRADVESYSNVISIDLRYEF